MFYTTPRIVYHTHKHSAATFVEGKVVLTITKMFFLSLAVADAVYLTYRPVLLMLTLKGFSPCCHIYC